jgi:hypothetical protein
MKNLVWTLCSVVLASSLVSGLPAEAGERLPPVWGYGVRSCASFVTAADGRDQGVDLQDWEYRRYQDWLTGFVTGLNLSTGKDVLVGVEIAAAMDRIRAHCRGNGKQDFFTATMDLVRMLSGLR